MTKCIYHPGKPSSVTLFQKNYCPACKTSMIAAKLRVRGHVQPKDCFIWYKNAKDKWQPIEGTGCAHFVAHELGIRGTGKTHCCLGGYICRVSTLVAVTRPVAVEQLQLNDVYVNEDNDHSGLVVRLTPGAKPTDSPKITIKHASSKQEAVAEDDFATYFKGKGSFRRYSS